MDRTQRGAEAHTLRQQVVVGIVATFAVTVIFGVASSEAATLTRCDADCTSNCELAGDLKCCSAVFCTGNGPINLSNGADLDMNGYDVECLCGKSLCSVAGTECLVTSDCPASEVCISSGCSNCAYAAVQMDGTSSSVKNTASDESTVRGNFTVGVDCKSKTSSEVRGIRMELGGQAIVVGAINCAKVHENVILGDGSGLLTFGISTAGVANSDFTSDNYVDNWLGCIQVTGDKGVQVDRNFCYLRTDVGLSGIRVPSATSSTLEVTNNIIMGVGHDDNIVVTGNATGTFANNLCDPENDACTDCIDDLYCDPPTAPFILP